MSTGVSYLAIQHHDKPGIDWDWLERQPAEEETALIRHLALAAPLTIKLDGQAGRAGIWHGSARG